MIGLNEKAGPEHYVVIGLVMVGLWYVIHKLTGTKQDVTTTLADASFEVTSLVIFAG